MGGWRSWYKSHDYSCFVYATGFDQWLNVTVKALIDSKHGATDCCLPPDG